MVDEAIASYATSVTPFSATFRLEGSSIILQQLSNLRS